MAAISFAQNAINRDIYIEGYADDPEQLNFFLENFKMEAVASGYTVVDNKADAGYTFRFNVFPNFIMYDDGSVDFAPPDEDQFVLQITFLQEPDEIELVVINYSFTDTYQMYDYEQYLFLKAAVFIPPAETVPLDEGWRNKLLYVRASFDYPITFYLLQPDELIGGKGVYRGSFDKPTDSMPVENRVVALPAGLTLGLEAQLLDWLSVEPYFKANLESMNDKNFIAMSAGLALKFPLKPIGNITLEPYGAFSFPLLFPIITDPATIFDSFPKFAFGGGLQLAMRGGRAGAFFVDLSFMYFGKTGIYNNYTPLYPQPNVIYFNRFIIGLSAGYKFGFIDRK